MTQQSDSLNCLKNLMQMMCADGRIHPGEKSFLAKAAKEMDVQVSNWKALLKETLNDNIPLYPIHNREKAVSTLKALIVMSKSDGQTDAKEKALAVTFAKSIGISKPEWQQILKEIDVDTLFEPFTRNLGDIIAVRDDFDKLDVFVDTASKNGAAVQTVTLREFLDGTEVPLSVVCFHAAQDKDASLTRCRMLLEKCGDMLVCILTRYQGHQVKYLLEIGLRKCIIEPVYAQDIIRLFAGEKGK